MRSREDRKQRLKELLMPNLEIVKKRGMNGSDAPNQRKVTPTRIRE